MTWSYVAYGSWIAIWAVLELLGLSGRVPWSTLSSTAWSLDRSRWWARLLFAVGLSLLTVHIAAPGWP